MDMLQSPESKFQGKPDELAMPVGPPRALWRARNAYGEGNYAARERAELTESVVA